VNLRGEPAGIPIEIKNGSFATALPAFAPASFVFDNRQPTNAINN
jgi:hypothetical protein